MVTATPTQLSACSIITRSHGARRCNIARGAVTSPLTTMLSVATRITWRRRRGAQLAASAGAIAYHAAYTTALAASETVVTVGAISSAADRHSASAFPAPSWPMLCAPSSATTTTPNAPNSRGLHIRASTSPITSVPDRADTASRKTRPMPPLPAVSAGAGHCPARCTGR